MEKLALTEAKNDNGKWKYSSPHEAFRYNGIGNDYEYLYSIETNSKRIYGIANVKWVDLENIQFKNVIRSAKTVKELWK